MTGKRMNTSSCDLHQVAIPAYAWKKWGQLWETSVSTAYLQTNIWVWVYLGNNMGHSLLRQAICGPFYCGTCQLLHLPNDHSYCTWGQTNKIIFKSDSSASLVFRLFTCLCVARWSTSETWHKIIPVHSAVLSYHFPGPVQFRFHMFHKTDTHYY